MHLLKMPNFFSQEISHPFFSEKWKTWNSVFKCNEMPMFVELIFHRLSSICRHASAFVVSLQLTGVNFINVFCAHFCTNFWRQAKHSQRKRRSYKKFVRLTLMKLTEVTVYTFLVSNWWYIAFIRIDRFFIDIIKLQR